MDTQAHIDALKEENERLEVERKKAVNNLCQWRSAFQECTPGGSEFMSPDIVRDFMRKQKADCVKAKLEAARLKAENERLREAMKEIEAFTRDVDDDHPLSHVCGTARAALSKAEGAE